MRKSFAFLPLAGGVSAMVQAFGGHRIRFDLEDGSGGGLAGGGSDSGDAGISTDTGTQAAPAEPMSIRDAITASLRQQEEAANPAATEGDAAAQAAADGRARNPDGTFAPKATDAGKEGQQAAAPDAAQAQAKPAAPANVPENLTPTERETFAKLPPEAQAVVAQHVQQVANERRFYGEMAPSMQAVQHFAQRFQMHPAQLVASWAKAQDDLSRDPVAAIKGLAQQFRVDLSKLAASAQPQEDIYVDPQVAQLQQQLASVQQFVQTAQQREQEAQRRQQEETQQRERAAVQAAEDTVRAFRETVDEAGKSKYPHFEQVKAHMRALFEAGAVESLEDAYEQAMWSRPDLRQQLLASQQAQAARQQQDARRQQAERARAAGVSVSGAPGGVAPPPSPGDTSIRGLLAKGAGIA